jgi:D-alanyl-D-alanine carboxypeptidase
MPSKFKKFFEIEARTRYFVPALVCFCGISIILFSSLIIIRGNSPYKNTKVKAKINPFENLSLQGKGIMVFDAANNKEIFSKNPDEPLPLASLTKVLTAVVAEKKLGDKDQVEITKEDLTPEGDSGLLVGDKWKAEDLRDFTLLTSSNDGAFALAAISEAKNNAPKSDFIKEMNDTASMAGLTKSRFFNEHGLDINTKEGKGGAYGSARDMVALFRYTLKNYPEILESTRYRNLIISSTNKTYDAENTNILIDNIPNVIASKTGYTELAGGNLVVAYDAGLNHPIIISVLGSTEEGRFEDVQKLVSATMKYITDGE